MNAALRAARFVDDHYCFFDVPAPASSESARVVGHARPGSLDGGTDDVSTAPPAGSADTNTRHGSTHNPVVDAGNVNRPTTPAMTTTASPQSAKTKG